MTKLLVLPEERGLVAGQRGRPRLLAKLLVLLEERCLAALLIPSGIAGTNFGGTFRNERAPGLGAGRPNLIAACEQQTSSSHCREHQNYEANPDSSHDCSSSGIQRLLQHDA